MSSTLRMTEAEYAELQARMGGGRRSAPAMPKITERQWQEQVEELAAMLGWKKYHTWNSIKSDPGFPDLVLVRPPRLIFAELKVDGKKPDARQLAWLDDVRECGVQSYLWYPEELEKVKEVLR